MVKQALRRAKWPNPVQPGLSPVTVLTQGEHSFFHVTLASEADPALLTCTVAGPAPLPRRGRRRVCEAVNRANAGLAFGRFELDDSPEPRDRGWPANVDATTGSP
jgi:hypothetical protein